MSLIQTFREHRIGGISLFDLILAIIAMELLFRYYNYKKWTGALYTIPIGILTHAIFGINTTLNYKLGISDIPDN